MLIGGIGAIVMMIIFLSLGAKTLHATFAVVISILAAFLAIAYGPWMASFTETIEKHNPALIATGLAVWGWIIRIVVAVSAFALPLVVGGMTPVITYGTQVQTLAAQYAPCWPRPRPSTRRPRPPSTLARSDTAALTTAVGEIAKAFNVTPAVATTRLTALAAVPKADLLFLNEHAAQVQTAPRPRPASGRTGGGCVGGMVLFLPFILTDIGGPVEPPEGSPGRGSITSARSSKSWPPCKRSSGSFRVGHGGSRRARPGGARLHAFTVMIVRVLDAYDAQN